MYEYNFVTKTISENIHNVTENGFQMIKIRVGFETGVKWSFCPQLNTVQCQKWTEGHRGNSIFDRGHGGK